MCGRNKHHLPALFVGFDVVRHRRNHRFTPNVRSSVQVGEESVTVERAKWDGEYHSKWSRWKGAKLRCLYEA